jgi:Tol biopolymer transport system component
MKMLALLALAGICQAGRPIQLEDYYRIEGASTPAISPDGKWVVFARSTILEKENQRHTDLWIAPSDGSAAAVKLTAGEININTQDKSKSAGVLYQAAQLAIGSDGQFTMELNKNPWRLGDIIDWAGTPGEN